MGRAEVLQPGEPFIEQQQNIYNYPIMSVSLLNDRYELHQTLGRGGMGAVYRAHDRVLKRDVAVKVVSTELLDTQGTTRLLEEAQAAARLNHPNIVAIYDAGEDDGTPFIIMELVEGATLAGKRPEQLEDILAVSIQICAALAHAHAAGIIHRDIKPDNVLVSEKTGFRQVRLMDFGLATSVENRLTTEGGFAGTLGYVSPEQALGHEVGPAADLYSFGVLLYELLTGRLPFEADDAFAIITQHLHAPVVPPRARDDSIPSTLDTLVLRLLKKQPEERPASAQEVIAILESASAPAPVTPAPESAPAPAAIPEMAVLDRIARGRIVGRARELKEARTLWEQASAGDGRTVLISGEPGIGKSRLVRELATQVEVRGGVTLIGKSFPEGGAQYAPFAQIFRRALARVNGVPYGLSNFVLSDLLSVTPELRPHYPDLPLNPDLDPESERRRLFENVVTFLQAVTTEAPAMLVLEDAHWADQGSLALLRHLARRTRDRRLMLVATYREVELDEHLPLNDLLQTLNRERLSARIKLTRLDRASTEDLLGALFLEEITPEFRDAIYRETEGNPFFVEEVVKDLVESGQIYYQDGRWHRPSISRLNIPQSVRVTIQSRIGKLPTEVQENLQTAAILGREFDFDTLMEVSGSGEDALIDALEHAERAQLIDELSSERSGTFLFVHALIPSTLLDGLTGLRRRRMHRRAADAVEHLRPEDVEALAFQYSHAEVEEKALRYLKLAADRARVPVCQ